MRSHPTTARLQATGAAKTPLPCCSLHNYSLSDRLHPQSLPLIWFSCIVPRSAFRYHTWPSTSSAALVFIFLLLIKSPSNPSSVPPPASKSPVSQSLSLSLPRTSSPISPVSLVSHPRTYTLRFDARVQRARPTHPFSGSDTRLSLSTSLLPPGAPHLEYPSLPTASV